MLPLGTEVGLGLGHIVLDGDPASPAKRGTAAPDFSAHFALARSPISATAELLLDFVCRFFYVDTDMTLSVYQFNTFYISLLLVQ